MHLSFTKTTRMDTNALKEGLFRRPPVFKWKPVSKFPMETKEWHWKTPSQEQIENDPRIHPISESGVKEQQLIQVVILFLLSP